MLQSSFFDFEDRFNKLDDRDPLVKLSSLIEWDFFRDTLNKVREKKRKSTAGRKPYDVVLMFKVLILQHLYNLSDDETEYQIRDRLFLSILIYQARATYPRCKNYLAIQGAACKA